MMEPSCHDYVPPKQHEFEYDPDDDRGIFGEEAWPCKYCPVIDWRWPT